MKCKIDWKRKLASRKFWMSVVGFVVAILAFNNSTPETTERVTALIMATGSLVAFVLAEGYVDGKAVESENDTE